MKKISVILVGMAVFAMLVMAGCGGGGGDNLVNRSGNASLTMSDEQLGLGPVDFITIRPGRSGQVVATMEGGTLSDPYIVVRRTTPEHWNDYSTYARDDDSGPGLDSRCEFWVEGGSVYTVGFTTFNGGTGSYHWSIRQYNDRQIGTSAEFKPVLKEEADETAEQLQ